MDFRSFLTLAQVWLSGTTEGERRSAISRAYYAAFHVAGELLEELGFAVPRAEQAHAFLWLRLANSGNPDVMRAGRDLKALRQERNRADYDRRRVVLARSATDLVRSAEVIIRILDLGRQEPVRTIVTDAMRTYERDVLQDVTWRP